MGSIWDARYVVVDVETTGSNPVTNGIIEISCVVVENGSIVSEFASLVNPHRYIPFYISMMTGITNEMVHTAPELSKVIPQVANILMQPNTIFVAHNASFDYDFVRHSFEQVGKRFPELPKLCTLRLARRLITSTPKKNVGALADYFNIPIHNRHRALGDAKATAQILIELLEIAENEHNIANVEELLDFQNKKLYAYNLAQKLEENITFTNEEIPDVPGVYYFIDSNGVVLYVGKAKSLRKRLQSYFSGSTTSKKILRLLRAISKVDWKTTETELSAVLLESAEIKRLQPQFNTLSRRYRSYPFIKISSKAKFPIFEISYEPYDDGEYYGPFKNREIAELALEIVYKEFRFKKCISDIDRKTPETRCLYFQTKQCIAPCLAIFRQREYSDELEKVRKFLTGYDSGLIQQLERQVKEYSEQLEFEKADVLLNQIRELKKVLVSRRNSNRQIRSKNVIAVANDSNATRKRYEILFIRDGQLANEISFGWHFSMAKIRELVRDTYFNGYLASDSLQPQSIDAMRIVSNWLFNNKDRISIIPVDGKDETTIEETLSQLLEKK
jgi:DNA polymerase-3 subunit epsilon